MKRNIQKMDVDHIVGKKSEIGVNYNLTPFAKKRNENATSCEMPRSGKANKDGQVPKLFASKVCKKKRNVQPLTNKGQAGALEKVSSIERSVLATRNSETTDKCFPLPRHGLEGGRMARKILQQEQTAPVLFKAKCDEVSYFVHCRSPRKEYGGALQQTISNLTLT